jgi:hypothetical protein
MDNNAVNDCCLFEKALVFIDKAKIVKMACIIKNDLFQTNFDGISVSIEDGGQ